MRQGSDRADYVLDRLVGVAALVGAVAAVIADLWPAGSSVPRLIWACVAAAAFLTSIALWIRRRRIGRSAKSREGIPQSGSERFPHLFVSMTNLSPHQWCVFGSADHAELLLRVAAALPAPMDVHATSRFATLLKGEERERLLVEALEASTLTTWLATQRMIWHWANHPTWRPVAQTYRDLTELRFDPAWDRATVRPPLAARCNVATGWQHPGDRAEMMPAIRVALDVYFNVLELDAERQIAGVRHTTTPAPVPGALTLVEVARALRELLIAAPRFASAVADDLLPPADFSSGAVAAWVAVSGVELGRVVDLSQLSRLEGGGYLSEKMSASLWPLPAATDGCEPADAFVASLLEDLLEESGYRGLRTVIAGIRQGG